MAAFLFTTWSDRVPCKRGRKETDGKASGRHDGGQEKREHQVLQSESESTETVIPASQRRRFGAAFFAV